MFDSVFAHGDGPQCRTHWNYGRPSGRCRRGTIDGFRGFERYRWLRQLCAVARQKLWRVFVGVVVGTLRGLIIGHLWA
jgi:hypothetical protein